MGKLTKSEFRFRKHSNIGAAAAEDDEEFLKSCYVDTGDLDVLLDCNNSKRIIVGRTGVGKSALIIELRRKTQNVINISPEDLSFNRLVESTILNYFTKNGVNLDLFYRLLWRHVFTVELIKKRYNISNEASKHSFIQRLEHIFSRDKGKKKAIDYLENWSDSFWEETDYRVKEITNKIEKELSASAGSTVSDFKGLLSGTLKINEEQKREVIEKGQNVVNSIQMSELSRVISFLKEDVFDDDQSKFYITIDRLDENWIDEDNRYLLLRSLIETIRDFKKVTNVKIIIVLRTDLLNRTLRKTRDAGFQEEKYRSLYLPIVCRQSNSDKIA